MAKSNTPPLRLSWSAILAYLKCQRKFELAYGNNLQKIPGAESRALMLGSATHAGVEAALLHNFNTNDSDPYVLVTAAISGVRKYIQVATIRNKTIYNYEYRTLVPDNEYYMMVREVGKLAEELVRFHVPLIGIGTRYLTASTEDVLQNVPPNTAKLQKGVKLATPAIEWNFEYDLGENTILTGTVDTVLWSVEDEGYVVVDWKTRGAFPIDSLAMLDGQTHLYAAVINAFAYHYRKVNPIKAVAMWQLRTKTPSPASISVKTNLPNTGAASYDTTWDYWVETLPAGIDPEKYRELMEPKMKSPDEFQRVLKSVVTEASSALAVENVQVAAESIRAALATGKALPAILSSDGCKFCDFVPICSTALRYGGDVKSVIDHQYMQREGRIAMNDYGE